MSNKKDSHYSNLSIETNFKDYNYTRRNQNNQSNLDSIKCKALTNSNNQISTNVYHNQNNNIVLTSKNLINKSKENSTRQESKSYRVYLNNQKQNKIRKEYLNNKENNIDTVYINTNKTVNTIGNTTNRNTIYNNNIIINSNTFNSINLNNNINNIIHASIPSPSAQSQPTNSLNSNLNSITNLNSIGHSVTSNNNQNPLSVNQNKEIILKYNSNSIEDTLTSGDNNLFLQQVPNPNQSEPIYIDVQKLINIENRIPLTLDLLNSQFPNYEKSKCSSKQMGIIKAYGANTHQGIVRSYNEDRVSICINMNKPQGFVGHWPKISFFGIYDGHGGHTCSEYLRDNLHKYIINAPNFPNNVIESINHGFAMAEKDFLSNKALNKINGTVQDRSGSCAVILLIIENKCYVANVGDSRGIMSVRNGASFKEITIDHKPNNPSEKQRIVNNGGKIYQSQTPMPNMINQILIGPYRVMPGRLSVSRTVGDIEAKSTSFGGMPNVIICNPEIFVFEIDKEDIDFIILGCDGIFDQLSNEDVINLAWMAIRNNNNFVDNNSYYHSKCGQAVDLIIKSAMSRKSFDNVTCLLVALKEMQKMCSAGGKLGKEGVIGGEHPVSSTNLTNSGNITKALNNNTREQYKEDTKSISNVNSNVNNSNNNNFKVGQKYENKLVIKGSLINGNNNLSSLQGNDGIQISNKRYNDIKSTNINNYSTSIPSSGFCEYKEINLDISNSNNLNQNPNSNNAMNSVSNNNSKITYGKNRVSKYPSFTENSTNIQKHQSNKNLVTNNNNNNNLIIKQRLTNITMNQSNSNNNNNINSNNKKQILSHYSQNNMATSSLVNRNVHQLNDVNKAYRENNVSLSTPKYNKYYSRELLNKISEPLTNNLIYDNPIINYKDNTSIGTNNTGNINNSNNISLIDRKKKDLILNKIAYTNTGSIKGSQSNNVNTTSNNTSNNFNLLMDRGYNTIKTERNKYVDTEKNTGGPKTGYGNLNNINAGAGNNNSTSRYNSLNKYPYSFNNDINKNYNSNNVGPFGFSKMGNFKQH